jgi:hypothetical protein
MTLRITKIQQPLTIAAKKCHSAAWYYQMLRVMLYKQQFQKYQRAAAPGK